MGALVNVCKVRNLVRTYESDGRLQVEGLKQTE